MSKNYIIYLWADTEKKIGLGHLNRLRFLSQAIKTKNISYKIITKSNHLSKSLIKKNVFFLKNNIKYFVKSMRIPSILKKEEKAIKIIIIDSYSVNKNFISKLKEKKFKIVYFNDFKKDINANLNICLGSNIKKKNYITGFNYVPLSKEFLRARKNLLNKKTVLISFGALDHYNLSLKLVKILSKYNLKIIVIIGRYYNRNIYKKLVKQKTKKIRIIHHPKNLFRYLKDSDTVICAGGFTVFESLSLGIPTLCIELWKNQSANLVELKRKKLIKYITFNSKKSLQLNKSNLKVLLNKKYRQYISKRTEKIISRKGSINILKEITKRL